MSDDFGSLEDVNVREAWTHEARGFTPWLAQNLQRLGQAIGINMELVEQERRVEQYAADIVAQDLQDDSIVLIENQLEATDHTHLGQIMTYLAGTGARTVVWIAREFQSAHLAAIQWLNDNTNGDYRFYAIRIRAVRIADSPIAPVFEVIGRPNEWQREARESVAGRGARAHLVALRREFWGFYLQRFPEAIKDGPPNGTVQRWRLLSGVFADVDLVIALLYNTGGVGVYLRGRRGIPESEIHQLLLPKLSQLLQKSGTTLVEGPNGNYVASWNNVGGEAVNDRARWPELADWLHENSTLLEQTLRELYG